VYLNGRASVVPNHGVKEIGESLRLSILKQLTGGLTVTFRDVPEALTQGHNVDEALENASDALMTALEFYFESRVKVPESTSGKRSEHAVNLPALISAKVALHNEMA
jgi:predicted RNase H-like HicB family nuclease